MWNLTAAGLNIATVCVMVTVCRVEMSHWCVDLRGAALNGATVCVMVTDGTVEMSHWCVDLDRSRFECSYNLCDGKRFYSRDITLVCGP